MRFFYVDPGLHGKTGHHPNTCQSICDELKSRQIPTHVLAFKDLDSQLREKFNATPLFRYSPYWRTDHDPICGPAYAFHAGAKAICEDLDALGSFSPNDLLFLPWATPAVFWGIVQWMERASPGNLPQVIVSFLDVPDVTFQYQGSQRHIGLPDYRIDPSPMFLRLAAKHATPLMQQRLRLGCFHAEGAAALGAVLGLPVERLPAPQHALTTCRPRNLRAPLIGFIGHQRGHAKGVYHIPDIIQDVLKGQDAIRFVIHDGSQDLLPEVRDSLLRMATSGQAVLVEQNPLDISQWATLLDRLDLVVCPYSLSEYRLHSSGVHNEAIANAIPSVVPADTTLSSAAQEFCGGSVTYSADRVDLIVSAILELLANFDRLARNAGMGAAKWREVNGPNKLIDALIRAKT